MSNIPFLTGVFPRTVTLACDTEFEGAHTLSVQVAGRTADNEITIQVYRSPLIPLPTSDFELTEFLPTDHERYGRFFDTIRLQPVKSITADLSPALMLRDLLNLDVEILSRFDGHAYLDQCVKQGRLPGNTSISERTGKPKVPCLTIEQVVHFQPADFYRLCGRQFIRNLLERHLTDGGDVAIQDGKRMRFVECRSKIDFNDPIVQYLKFPTGELVAIKLSNVDSMLPFGEGSLDSHCKTFLDISKSEAIPLDDKKQMRRTFQDKTDLAYGYGITDAVNTLLVYERMFVAHNQIYRKFGFSQNETPRMRNTLGARGADFIKRTARQSAPNSIELSSDRAITALMKKGSASYCDDANIRPRFGRQVTVLHGGLLFSRSPTRFWHEAPGRLSDVDLAGCYNKIISNMNVYLGRPVVFEPGRERWNLQRAVHFCQEQSPQDAWFVRVTGNIESFPNCLVPSSLDALTGENFTNRRAKTRSKERVLRGVDLQYMRRLPNPSDDLGAKLFSKRIESGVITYSIWRMIQALPTQLRSEYESLTVDSIALYPNELIAANGREYDHLIHKYRNQHLPWGSTIDLVQREIITKDHIDSEYVSLRYPIGEFAKRIGEFRAEVQNSHGKGSGIDKAWKLLANATYGVLACEHLDASNYVAANQVTATARALAFAMMMSLNGIQVITDGCTYRRDQVPANTFRECLQTQQDYPLRHTENDLGIRFLDESRIPRDDRSYTTWYRDHVKRFFEVDGTEYDDLFGLHQLDHKLCGNQQLSTFDGLAVDGSGNYLKCRKADDSWVVEEMSARSYKVNSKENLKPWIVDTYCKDRITTPPPITSDDRLLKHKEAVQIAMKALRQSDSEVFVPLGMRRSQVKNYKVIKQSSLVFQSPDQLRAFEKTIDKFQNETGCGIEILAMRRSYRNRRKGSLCDLAAEIYHRIQSGQRNFNACLNTSKIPECLKPIIDERLAELIRRKADGEAELFRGIDTGNLEADGQLVGYFVTRQNLLECYISGTLPPGSMPSWT